MKYLTLAGCFIALYVLNIVLKFSFYTFQIRRGKRLIGQLTAVIKSPDALSRLYPSLKRYCHAVGLKAYVDPYGKSDSLVNKANSYFQKQLRASLNETIGVYMYRRRYCYILLSVHNDDKTFPVFKIILDAVLKVAASMGIDAVFDFLKMLGK